MRIISGKFKGREIFMPKDKITRPIKDMMKESIFNTLEHSNKFKNGLTDKKILDIFSGTGSFGLECISRGASNVVFIENYKPALEILKKNINNFKIGNQCIVFDEDILKINSDLLKKFKFDIIFLDPPYKIENIENVTNFIYCSNILKNNGILLIHRNKKSIDDLKGFEEIDTKIYGISKILILKLG